MHRALLRNAARFGEAALLRDGALLREGWRGAAARSVLGLSAEWAELLAGGRPSVDGRRLNPHVHLLLALERFGGRSLGHVEDVAAARAYYRELSSLLNRPESPARITFEQAVALDGRRIRVRVHRPSTERRLPGVVFFHGGGFVLGDLETHRSVACRIAHACRAVVVQVDYRLAPEHPFPAAVEDCSGVTAWVLEQADALGIDPSRVGLVGDSAGGTLAAVTAQRVPGLRCQLLIYPATDATYNGPSKHTYATGFGLDRATVDWFTDQYTQGAPLDHPEVSPLKSDRLGICPPTHVVVAGFDVLRDEALMLADALRDAGVPTTRRIYDQLTHGFIHLTQIPRCDAAVQGVCEVLRGMLQSG